MAWIKVNATGAYAEVSDATAGSMVLSGYAELQDKAPTKTAQKEAAKAAEQEVEK